ncbi:hypothetical protein PanWU01x14_360420 [Parasponia andersonii]|uniref:Uncharacterized protein n=1 Tax=Parasponia andersonii TaxID=3476 RepID=A0A2P5A7P4_PARAD|nr:hypothetical protein PanWU01x14_360420 [Parasponia andersonii]
MIVIFFRTGDKTGSSYLWKSSLWGRELIFKGVQRVGNGPANIRILDDTWVHRPILFRPISQPRASVTLVKDIMLSPSSWNGA